MGCEVGCIVVSSPNRGFKNRYSSLFFRGRPVSLCHAQKPSGWGQDVNSMETTKTGGEEPQDVREGTLRSKRMKADALVSHASERNAGGLPYVQESVWHKKVEIGKNDEFFLDMVIDFCELMIYVADSDNNDIEYLVEEYLEQAGQLAQMYLQIVMEVIAIKKGMKKEGAWIVDLNE